MDTIIITGVCSAFGRLLAGRLCKTYKVIGIDRKKWEGQKPKTNFIMHEGDLRKKILNTILRKQKGDIRAVIHLAVSRNYSLSEEKLHEMNIITTRMVLNAVMENTVQKFILLSEHSVYGALPGNPMWLKENSPLNGGRIFKENTSVVEVDLMSTELFWRKPDIETVILRPVNILGPKTNGLLNIYLKLGVAPSVMGFNPMMQIIHEDDVIRAMENVLETDHRGIFNVVGPGALPLPVLAKESGLNQIPLPAALAYNAVRFFAPLAYKMGHYLIGMSPFPFPPSGLSFFQYVLNVDGDSFKQTTGFEPKISLVETIQSIK